MGSYGSSGGNPPSLKNVEDKLDRLKEPHWTTVPLFVLTIIAVIAAVLSGWFAWRADVRATRADSSASQAQHSLDQAVSMLGTNATLPLHLSPQPKQ
jgi:hypothetical protein